MIYYTYLVIPTNEKSRLFGTVYFGKHKTENLDDSYIGSGKQISRYLKKYPTDFYREIIKYYFSEEELNKAEYDLIHPHLNKSYCLNLMEGGHGGTLSKESREKFIKSSRGKKLSHETKKRISDSLKKYFNDNNMSEETKLKMSLSRKGRVGPNKDKKHSEDTKKRMSESHKGKTTWNKGLKKEDQLLYRNNMQIKNLLHL